MKRVTMAIAALTLLGLAAAPASADTYFGFQIGIGNAPPPPRIVFVHEPRCELVPETRVYRVAGEDPGCDVFRSGDWWYCCKDGYWYRARSHRGPFAVVDVRSVPRAVLTVPPARWRHHPHGGPPGQWKKREVAVAREKHGHGRGPAQDDE